MCGKLFITGLQIPGIAVDWFRRKGEPQKMNDQAAAHTSWEELGISNDFLFGKVMQLPELCKELLHRILPDLEIDHIEYPEAQKGINADVDV